MRLLTRYVLIELTKVFAVALCGMTLVLLLAGVGQEAVRQGMGLGPILRLVPYFLPHAMVFAVPGTILFAVCSVYGRIAADNELVAIKSLGISPFALLGPGFVLAFLLSLTAVWLNDVAASWGQHGIHRVVLQSVEQIAYGLLRTQHAYSTDRFSINVVDVQDRDLIQPTVTFHATGEAPPFTVTAEQARLELTEDRDALFIVLRDCLFDWGADWTGDLPGVTEYRISLTMAARKGASLNLSNVAMHMIPRRVDEQRRRIQALRQQYAAEAAYELLAGDVTALGGKQWDGYQRTLDGAQRQLYRLYLVPWRRWANGFSCLFFVLVGAPLALRLKNADIWTSFGLCFLPILLVYYPVLMYGVSIAKGGDMPPYTVWFGNGVLLGIGLWLLRLVLRR